MIDIDFERVRSVFLAARHLDTTRRQSLLRQECDREPAIRAEVESLLVHYDSQRGRATTPVIASAVEAFLTAGAPVEEPLPRAFGPFELLEVIGRGGMGTVYRARQRTPDRSVAVKVIRPGMMSATMLGRFRYEADLLARLQHPGIAQIFEAGAVTSADGQQPYFAMELISGEPIDLFVSQRHLAIRERLQLLVKVCDAVHHAHQKGVIHRDLKPCNILVDDAGQPRVLDFGVARATDADLRTTTLQTHAGQLIGTLPYMSPEQVAGDPRRLDVRSDVYALGVLTFELLTGRLPHDLHDKSVADAAVTIRDVQPPRLGAIAPALRGDLETITGKALEKDPSRRYDSAAALAEDIRRFLAYQPIIARPPSVMYQLRLFARRHRAVVAGGAVGVAALILATIVSLAFAIHSRRAAAREAHQRLVAERTSGHLESVLMMPDPHRGGSELTVAGMLDLMIEQLDTQPELPEVEARVRGTIGTTLLNQRHPERAIAQLDRAVALWRSIDPRSPDLARHLISLAIARLHLNLGDESEAAYREAISIYEELNDPALASARGGLLDMLIRRRKFDEALPIARDFLAAARAGDDPVRLIARLRQIAKVEFGLGLKDDSHRDVIEACSVARALPESNPMRVAVLLDLCNIRREQGNLAGALEASSEAFELTRRVGKPGSHDWQAAVHTHAGTLELLDRRDELIEVLATSRAAVIAAAGAQHAAIAPLEQMLTRLCERWGQPDRARAILETTEPRPQS
jgi:serine/threonine protein kinase